MPGAPYYLAAVLLFTAMLLATRVEQPQYGETHAPSRGTDETMRSDAAAAGAALVADQKENI
jgi:hypothetical protein